MVKETYQDYYFNVLKALRDGRVYKNKEIREKVLEYYDYSEDELNETLPSGQNVISVRVGWSITFLKKAKVIENVKRGHYKITERGKELFDKNQEINDETLKQFPEFSEFILTSRKGKPKVPKNLDKTLDNTLDKTFDKTFNKTPIEIIEYNYLKINNQLADELLETIKSSSPQFFEKLVVDLILKMGYGGSREDAGKAIGKSRDGGIDGIINEDVLGLDNIYIQAKRWENTVGRPEIQKFAGALIGQNANKGVFITTSDFTKGALEYAEKVDKRIILIEGIKLTQLMIRYDVGVSVESTYELKKIDSDYFDEIV